MTIHSLKRPAVIVAAGLALLLGTATQAHAQDYGQPVPCVQVSPPGTEQYEVSPGRYDTQWVAPVYATAYDPSGRPYTYVAQPGYSKTVWVPPVYGYRQCAAQSVYAPQTVVYTSPQPVCVQPTVYAQPVACAPATVCRPVVCEPVACAPVACAPVSCTPVACQPSRPSVSFSFSFGSGSVCSPRPRCEPVVVCAPPRPRCEPTPVCYEPRRSYSGWSVSSRESGSRSSVSVNVNVRSRR